MKRYLCTKRLAPALYAGYLMITLMVGGCSSTPTTEDQISATLTDLDDSGIVIKGQIGDDGRIVLDNDENKLYKDVEAKFRLEDLRARTERNGIARMQASLVSETDRTLDLQYRVIWLDSQGFQLGTEVTGGWFTTQLAGKESRIIRSAAPRADARFFQIWVRNIDYK